MNVGISHPQLKMNIECHPLRLLIAPTMPYGDFPRVQMCKKKSVFFFYSVPRIVRLQVSLSLVNTPFPSSLVLLFQSESKCKTILKKLTLIYMKMKLHAELSLKWKVSQLDSLRNSGTGELGNGLLLACMANCYLQPGAHYFHTDPPSTLSRIFLFLEASPTGIPAGVLIIANHKRAVILYCYTSQRGYTKVFQQWRKTGKVYHIFRMLCGRQRVFVGH